MSRELLGADASVAGRQQMKSPPSVSMEDSLKHLADRLHASPSSNAALIQKALSVGAPQEVVLPLLLRFVCNGYGLDCISHAFSCRNIYSRPSR